MQEGIIARAGGVVGWFQQPQLPGALTCIQMWMFAGPSWRFLLLAPRMPRGWKIAVRLPGDIWPECLMEADGNGDKCFIKMFCSLFEN